MFYVDGNSHGREPLRCDYDPELDQLFLRNGLLIIIKGGKSASLAALNQKASLIGKRINNGPTTQPAWNELRVSAYALDDYFSKR